MGNQLSKHSFTVDRVTTPLIPAVHKLVAFLFNVGLLGLPLYLESQGQAVLEEAERHKTQCDESKKSSAALPNGGETTVHVEANGHKSGINTSSPERRSNSLPDSAMMLAHSWAGYVKRREIEWIYYFLPISLAFVNAPTIFQFPGANDDTFTRWFTSLAMFRAMSSVLYMVFFHVYVRDRVKDVNFIMDRLYPTHMSAAVELNPWMILSFPAATTGWTVLFYMCAVTSFVLGGGPVATSPSVKTCLLLTVVILVAAVVDLMCMVWIGMTLKGYGKFSQGAKRAKVLRGVPQGAPVGSSDKICGVLQV